MEEMPTVTRSCNLIQDNWAIFSSRCSLSLQFLVFSISIFLIYSFTHWHDSRRDFSVGLWYSIASDCISKMQPESIHSTNSRS